ncbi:MAG: AMP-binding protein, partial [Deltaproteobacteria bacterium]|nr:AMP-binding protein [Deltaproteobacteria bacterium]
MPFHNKKIETASRQVLEGHQFGHLKKMLEKVCRSNPFYTDKYGSAGIRPEDITSLDDLKLLPFTHKEELEQDQVNNPPFGTTLTEPLDHYVQYHQTTGTTGMPIKMLDTRESWNWRGECACYILAAAGVTSEDTILIAFNFGPYTAFWILYEGAYKIGSLIIPTGGWNTEQRLDCLLANRVTVLAGTPTYVLRMAAVAREKNIDLRNSDIRILILSGEAGALDPVLRDKIEGTWGAKAFDYVGLTEVGTWGFQCHKAPTSIHIMESEFIAEIIDPETGQTIREGEEGELVLTNLGRTCNPAIRFRTRDIVKALPGTCACGRTFRSLDGGILGRQDQMVKIRGINIFPSTVGVLVEKHMDPGYEYKIIALRENDRDDIRILIEKEGSQDVLHDFTAGLQSELKRQFNLSFRVEIAEKGTLPRYEHKAK